MRGRILTFDGGDGLGNLELADGRVVRFGLRDCQGFAPVPGMHVEVPDVVPGLLKGQLRASAVVYRPEPEMPWMPGTLVAPDRVRLDDGRLVRVGGGTERRTRRVLARDAEVRVRVSGEAVVEIDERVPAPSPKEALRRAQEAGLAREMTAAKLRVLIADCFDGDDDSAELLPILCSWYESNPEWAARDGWVHHDWRFLNEVTDPIAELASRTGHPPVLELVACEPAGDALRLRVRRQNGSERVVESSSYADVVGSYNDELAEAGLSRRFVSLDTQGDFFAYAFVEPATARRLAAERVLPFEAG